MVVEVAVVVVVAIAAIDIVASVLLIRIAVTNSCRVVASSSKFCTRLIVTYYLVMFWLRFGYVLVTFWLRLLCFGYVLVTNMCVFWLRFGYGRDSPGNLLVTSDFSIFSSWRVGVVEKTTFLVTCTPSTRNQFFWLCILGHCHLTRPTAVRVT